MNTLNDKNEDHALEKMLKDLENGKSPQEILDVFPEHRKMLHDVLASIRLLEREKESIRPSRALLDRIVARIPSRGTQSAHLWEYLSRDRQAKGRFSFPDKMSTQLDHSSIATSWNILFPVGVVAVIALIIVTTQFTGTKGSPIAANDLGHKEERIEGLGDGGERSDRKEISVGEADTGLEEAGSDTNITPLKPSATYDPFALAAIQSESQKIAFSSEFDTFFSEETSLKEIDVALIDF